ncbi:hypothetical protein RRG08_014682 [Elysia crispata]|uniref:Uncharacterized protein n=1 Tax=Elysia crispata TaxID=231223 RepID=A0AAE1CZK7_9GAST|nr:hypothetical protein RRG08_014682 [Elysia crispata]
MGHEGKGQGRGGVDEEKHQISMGHEGKGQGRGGVDEEKHQISVGHEGKGQGRGGVDEEKHQITSKIQEEKRRALHTSLSSSRVTQLISCNNGAALTPGAQRNLSDRARRIGKPPNRREEGSSVDPLGEVRGDHHQEGPGIHFKSTGSGHKLYDNTNTSRFETNIVVWCLGE